MKVKKTSKKDLKIITLNISVRLLNTYTDLSSELGVSRNNLMILALNEYLEQHDALKQLPSLIEQLQQVEKH